MLGSYWGEGGSYLSHYNTQVPSDADERKAIGGNDFKK